MFKRFAKGALAAAAGVTALTGAFAVPSVASAQPYGYGYDPCQRSANNRGVVGALIGGALGASIGANAAARNARQDGALLGGAVGAIGGAMVGKNGAACNGDYRGYNAPPPPPPVSYYDNGYYDRGAYADRGYGRGDYYGSRYDDDSWAYGRRGERFRIAERPVGRDGCTLAESPIYLPDGRVQKRFVRVCQDSSGRYQVVD
ncbi:hypothetical protein DJ018_14335 [Phenylobacterium deserti]|uniref:17 kDa surface antigen n=2 Tax=Phenylobacterium deserti TaxID=1914756 RepID=A0A328AG76_9CAUL|nr:hypothetical protein DJ018_14335 [Phenylobacterium deserti]